MNEIILRLVDDNQLGGIPIPGARHIPRAPAPEQRVRDLLLGETPDRFSTLILLQRLAAHSDLYRSAAQSLATYGPWLDGYGLWDTAEGLLHGRLLRTAREWPVERILVVEGPGPELTLTLGDRTWSVTAVEDNGLWTGDWPPELGLSGALELDGETDRLIVEHRPVVLDWEPLYARLKPVPELQPLLIEAGLDRYFYQAPNPEEGVLAATQALIQANQDITYV